MDPIVDISVPISLLLVEDEADTLAALVNIVNKLFPDLVLHTAVNGGVGLELFKAHRSAIVLTDINMPVLDGIALSAAIKSLAPETVIIAMTAFTDASYLLKAIEIGINRYVLKPVDIQTLHSIVDASIIQVTAAQKSKAQSEHIRKLSIAVEQSPSCVVITDLQGNIEYVNPLPMQPRNVQM